MADDDRRDDDDDTRGAGRARPPEDGFGIFSWLQNNLTELRENSQEPLRALQTWRSMFGELSLKNLYLNPTDPQRMQAMADAGAFLRDAREVAGISAHELANTLGLRDPDLIEEVERGEQTLSLEMIFRIASLIARNDPVPFILRFLRTYSPAFDAALERWGVAVVPKYFERDRRFSNIYRSQDRLRGVSDEMFQRYMGYMEAASELALTVMFEEQQDADPASDGSKSAAVPATKTKKKKKAPRNNKSAGDA